MLIVQVYWYHDTVTGDFYYRIKQPGLALQLDAERQVVNVHVLHPLFPDLALAADLLICHMCAEPEIGPLIRLRQKLKRPTVFEISDHFLAPHRGIAAGDGWRSPILRERLLNHAYQADALQMSTHGVAKRYSGLNKHPVVFENRIEHLRQPRAVNPERVVLGWGGSMGHDHDLAGWKPKLLDLLQEYPQLHLAFMCPQNVFQAHFGAFPQERISFNEPGPLGAYYAFLETLDIGLAPAEDTPFNRCRSDGKFVEYAAHGVVPVLADIEPFRRHGESGKQKLIYDSLNAGVAHIRSLLDDGAYRGALARAAFDWVKRERCGADQRRLAFYQHLLTPDSGQETSGFAQALPEADGLMAGLRLAHADYDLGAVDRAEARLDDLLTVFPGYHQAQFALLECWQAAGKFEAIIERLSKGLMPHSLYRDLSMAILVRALRALGRKGAKAVNEIISDEVVTLELASEGKQQKLEALADVEPFRRDVIRFLLLSRSAQGVVEGVGHLAQVLGIIEDSVQYEHQDEHLSEVLRPFF